MPRTEKRKIKTEEQKVKTRWCEIAPRECSCEDGYCAIAAGKDPEKVVSQKKKRKRNG